MKNKTACFLAIIVFILGACNSKDQVSRIQADNAKYIDPFICTADDHGQTDVAAAVPFGMVKPCPDTYPIGHSGYDYSSKDIIGFSHTRFSGVGCTGAGGNIRILPFTNTDTVPQKLGYDKSSEVAEPGFYAVSLDGNIEAKLTATNKVAFHSYQFPASDKSGLSVDLASTFVTHISEQHQIDKEGILSGMVESGSVCNLGKYSFYYAFYVDKKDVAISDEDSKVIFRFATSRGEELKAYCALSVISEFQAKATLKSQMNRPFNDVKSESYEKWNDLINVVDIQSKDEKAKRLFYTHLYHATQSPFLISEDDGSYRGSDGKIYKNALKKYYHGWSVWDTFRSKLPLLSFLFPDEYKYMMASVGELYKQIKVNWASDSEPFITVRTEHFIVVLLEAHRKGLLTYSLDDIYPFLKEEAENLPFKSPDNQLESSFDLWALSEIARDLGYDQDAKEYLAKAMDYQPLWKDTFLHMGDNADIMHGDGIYEGTLWQYRWFVPFDISGIQDLLGGKDVFEHQLDYFFNNELFNIGNQPDIQVPYLYAYTNSPWKTQKVVHDLMNQETNNWYGTHEKWEQPITRKIFMDSPYGYIKEMDDDAGTMSAWYVWSAIGFYPVFPGSLQMVISTPQFDKITIRLPNATLEVETVKPSEKAIYIQKVEIDGMEHSSCFIDFNRLTQGGKIKIELGEKPNENWGN
jgi:putative alpha-1,2-mannosidase